MEITGKTALVTGANRGLGRHLAQELRDRGATVYAAARNPASVDLAGVIPIALDVTDPASVAAAAARDRERGDPGQQRRLLDRGLAADRGPGRRPARARHPLLRHARGHPRVRPAARRPAAQRGAEHPVGAVLGELPGQRRLLRRQVGRVVADQRPPPGARAPGHPGQRPARRLHGHRHGQARRRRPSPTRPTSPRSRSTASRRATRRSSPTSSAGRSWPASRPASPASTRSSPDSSAARLGRGPLGPRPRSARDPRSARGPARPATPLGPRPLVATTTGPGAPDCHNHGATSDPVGRALRCEPVPAARDSVP